MSTFGLGFRILFFWFGVGQKEVSGFKRGLQESTDANRSIPVTTEPSAGIAAVRSETNPVQLDRTHKPSKIEQPWRLNPSPKPGKIDTRSR